jgi:hypothetical protein
MVQLLFATAAASGVAVVAGLAAVFGVAVVIHCVSCFHMCFGPWLSG